MMKKTLYTMAAITLLAVPAAANAQGTTVGAGAAVDTYTNLTGASSIVFPALSRSSLNTVDAAGGTGAATRTLEYNQNVTITYSGVPTDLTATINGASATLPVTLKCAYRVGTAAWSAASACSSASFAMDVGSTLTTGTLGFGGDILAASVASALAGTYSGEVTVVITPRT
jgi:hypothetical protein